MVWIWLANTIAFLFIFTLWGKGNLLDVCVKFGWLALGIVNGMMLYRELSAMGFFTAAGA